MTSLVCLLFNFFGFFSMQSLLLTLSQAQVTWTWTWTDPSPHEELELIEEQPSEEGLLSLIKEQI